MTVEQRPTRSWRTRCPLVWCAAAVLFALCCAQAAEAGVSGIMCTTPFVFRDAAVNVVVLPYQSAPGIGKSPAAGFRLSRLFQLEALRSIAKFGSVGTVQMEGLPEQCDPDVVLAKLLGRVKGAHQTLREGQGLVLVWGRFYEDAGSLFVQTFCRVMRVGSPEALDLPAGGERFSGRVSADAYAFQRRKVTENDLNAFEEQFSRSTILRDGPSETARETGRIPPEPIPYWVSDTRGDWMLIDSRENRLHGWLHLTGTRDTWSLVRWLPELSYIEGAVGYLRCRIAERANREVPAQWIQNAQRALLDYEVTLDVKPMAPESLLASSRTPFSTAVELQYRGILSATRPGATIDDRVTALALFEQAARVVPYDSNAKNLVLMTQLFLASANRAQVSPKRTADELLQLFGSDPTNRQVLANLQSGYKLILNAGTPLRLTDVERQEMTSHLASIQRLSVARPPQ